MELLKEAKRLAADTNHPITAPELEVVRKWCIAAATKDTNKPHSILYLNTTAVTSDAVAFVDHKQHKCEAILGPAVSPAGQLAADQARAQAMASSLVAAMVPTMMPLLRNNNGGGSNQTTGGIDASGLTKGRELETAEKLQICGWSGVPNFAEMSAVWRELAAASSLISRRAIVKKMLAKFETSTGYAVNPTVHIPEHFFKEVLSLKVDYDEAVATYTNLDRGFSAQVALEVTLEYITAQTDKERARAESQNQRTYSESLAINKTAPRSPPIAFESLKLALATYAGLLAGFFTENCPLYKDVLALRAALDLPQVVQKKACYTPRVCMTHWYNVLNQSRAFFHTKADEDDFKGSAPRYPQSIVSHAIPVFMAGQPIEDVSFPSQWNKLITEGGAPPAGKDPWTGGTTPTQPGWGGANNNTTHQGNDGDMQQMLSHCHVIVLEEFKEFHKVFGGHVMFFKLCEHSRVSPKDLPYLTAHGRGEHNNLCYSYILGKCMNRNCKRAHVEKDQLPRPFLCELCDKTKIGRESLIRTEKQHSGSVDKRGGVKRKFGKRN